MIIRNFLTLACIISFYCCADSHDTHSPRKEDINFAASKYNEQNQSNSNYSIQNGPRQGFTYIDSSGKEFTYRYITTTISNDSVPDLHLKINFSKGNHRTDKNFKSAVFLLPRYLTPKRQQFDQNMSMELKLFLDKVKTTPVIIDTVLNTNEHCVMTFGSLTETGYPEPREISLKTMDTRAPAISVILKLDSYSIPCGEITFTDGKD